MGTPLVVRDGDRAFRRSFVDNRGDEGMGSSFPPARPDPRPGPS